MKKLLIILSALLLISCSSDFDGDNSPGNGVMSGGGDNGPGFGNGGGSGGSGGGGDGKSPSKAVCDEYRLAYNRAKANEQRARDICTLATNNCPPHRTCTNELRECNDISKFSAEAAGILGEARAAGCNL